MLDTIAVVVAAGLTTGLVAHMSIGDILNTLGEAFVQIEQLVYLCLQFQ